MRASSLRRQSSNFKRAGLLILCGFLPAGILFLIGCNNTVTNVPGDTTAGKLVPQAKQIIRESLADENPYVRARAIEVVGVTEQAEFAPVLQQLMQDKIVPVRFSAAVAVGDLRYKAAESSVRQLLKDPDDSVRLAANYALMKLGFPGGFEILRESISSENQTIRANAAFLLGKAGKKEALVALYRARDNENSDYRVRFQAAESIARLGDEKIYSKLWAMLISSFADDRVIGIQAMGALGTAQAENALITMLKDDVPEVRLAAAEQLGRLGNSTGEAEVIDVFEKNLTSGLKSQDRDLIYMHTALAIGEIHTPKLIEFLPQLLNDKSKIVRIAAAKAVLQCYKKY